MTRKGITIRTVAEAAGVSVTTVSRVIRQHPDVAEETRANVQEVIERLKYRPSAVARTMVSNRSHTLGLMVADIDNPYYSQLAKSVEAAAYAQGIKTILCNTADDSERELSYLEELLARRVDGVIQASHCVNSPLIDSALDNSINVVAVNRPAFDKRIDTVILDNHEGARRATQHLIDLGHHRIAHIEGPPEATNHPARRAGYEKALAENSIEIDSELVFLGPAERDTPASAVDFFVNLPSSPTAIFAADDMFAISALSRYLELGFRVPEDVSIVGFDGTAIASLGALSITTISQDIDYVGTRAVEILLKRAQSETLQSDNNAELVEEILEPDLVIRASTGPPPNKR